MYDALSDFLERTAGPDRVGPVIAAMHILERYGLVNTFSEISLYLNTANGVDIQQVLLNIDSMTHAGLNAVLDAHQIKVDGNLSMKVDVLEGLKVLMDYEDSSTIMQFCELDDDPIQTLSDMLAMVTTRTWADYADALQSVSRALINRLADLHRDRDEEMAMETPTLTVDPVRKEASLRHFNGYLTSLAKHAVVEDMSQLGTSFELLVERYKETLAEYEPRAAKQAAIDIVGLALIGDISMTDFIRQTKDKIEHIYTDINFITQVDMEMDAVFKGVMGHG